MKWYYNMKLGTKMITGFLIVALIAGAIGLVGIINIREIEELGTKMYEMMTQPLGEMVVIVSSYQRMQNDIRDIILAESQGEIDDYKNRIALRNAEFTKNINSRATTLFSEEGKRLVAEVISIKQDYDNIVKNIIVQVEQGNRDRAMELLREGNTVRTELERRLYRLAELKVISAEETSRSNSNTAKKAVTQMMILIAVGLSISIFLGFFISSSIRKPINKLVAISRRIADGDLDVEVDFSSKDEVGQLASAFSDMTRNVNEVMVNINSAAEQVASGSRQLSSSSQALSQGATEQASSIEEITSSLEELSAQTNQNAASAEKASQLSNSAKDKAAQGNLQMAEMLKSMADINDSSSNISKIIKVIDEIAFQTNILSLNAAVEAARAGQHGKGFAVVAEEVRNLAARSANAAKETTAMIEGSIKKVEIGTKIANETAVALNTIVESVSDTAKLVSEIAIASNEQASGIAQVNQAVMQVSQVVQTNSATSEEAAAASEELSSQSEILMEMVSKFKLRRSSFVSNNFESINPELLKIIEGMRNQKNEKKSFQGLKEAKKEAAASKLKIDLSDTEYGKY